MVPVQLSLPHLSLNKRLPLFPNKCVPSIEVYLLIHIKLKHRPQQGAGISVIVQHLRGSRDGVVVRALASHQCGRGSIPVLGIICGLGLLGLGLLLVLVLALRGFSPGTLVFSSPQKPTLLNSNSIWKVSLISALH